MKQTEDGFKAFSENDSALSAYFDLIRFLSAILVFLSHACRPGFSADVLPNLEQFGSDVVIVFFVLSGFVIAHSASHRHPGFSDFLLARLARLWSVAIPALLLAAFLEHIGQLYNAELYAQMNRADSFISPTFLEPMVESSNLVRLFFGIFFLNDIWRIHINEFSNAPYWSLCNEFWYYMLFGACFYARAWWRVALVALVAFIGGRQVLVLLPVWLAGVGLYRWRPIVPPRLALLCMIAPIPIYLLGYEFDCHNLLKCLGLGLPFGSNLSYSFLWPYAVGGLAAVHLIGAASFVQTSGWLVRRRQTIRWWAGRTLSIYLFHFPILCFLGAVLPTGWPPVARGFAILAATAGAICGLSFVTEDRKTDWRAFLDRTVMGLVLICGRH